jgi:hypothetical protein
MSVLANIVWQTDVLSYRSLNGVNDPPYAREKYDHFTRIMRLVALEQFARAYGHEQADVIRALLAQAKSDVPRWDIHDTDRIFGILQELIQYLDLSQCADVATREYVLRALVEARKYKYWTERAMINWHEVARAIEGRRAIPVFATANERWRDWFLRETDRHFRYFGGECKHGYSRILHGLLYSSEEACASREAASKDLSPSQYYEHRLEQLLGEEKPDQDKIWEYKFQIIMLRLLGF